MSTENKNIISRRILVADDDPVIRHLITSLIEKEYYEAVVVNDGKEAYRILQSDSNFCAAIRIASIRRFEKSARSSKAASWASSA